jgi:hypothetical protein
MAGTGRVYFRANIGLFRWFFSSKRRVLQQQQH